MPKLFKEVSKNLKKVYLKKKVAKQKKARQQAPFVKFDIFDLPQKFYQVAPLDWVPGPYQERLKAVKAAKISQARPKARVQRSKLTIH